MTLPVTLTSAQDSIDFAKAHNIKQCNWQLFPQDLANIEAEIKKLQDIGVEVVSLHSPFNSEWMAIRIETYFEERDYIESVLYAAEQVGKAYNKKLPLVFHTCMMKNELKQVKAIAEAINTVLLLCPHVDMVLENTGYDAPIDKDVNIIPPMVPDAVNEFNKYLKGVRIGSCLDICHAEIVNRVGTLLIEKGINAGKTAPTVKDFAKLFGEDCHLVHLANTEAYGTLKPFHGTGFWADSVKDEAALKYYLKVCREHLPNAVIVLEISERDYQTRPRVVQTLALLNSFRD